MMPSGRRKVPNPNAALPAFQIATSVRLRLNELRFLTFPTDAETALFPEVRLLVVDFLSTEAGLARRPWPKLIAAAYPELKGLTLENMLVKLVVRCFKIRCDLQEAGRAVMLHDFIEYCAGEGNLTCECCSATYIATFFIWAVSELRCCNTF